MKIKELSPEDRPREKLLAKGPEALSTAELLAIVLRTGAGQKNAVDMARELLNLAGHSLLALSAMSIERLTAINGIGKDKAASIMAVMELGRKLFCESSATNGISITGPEMIYNLMAPGMRGLDHEECWVIFLNRANYILSKERLSYGGMSSTVIDIRIILRKILEKKASGIILVHNHPSGNSRPGKADICQTEHLKKALEPFDVSLIDHIVISDNQFFSFSDNSVTIVENNGFSNKND